MPDTPERTQTPPESEKTFPLEAFDFSRLQQVLDSHKPQERISPVDPRFPAASDLLPGAQKPGAQNPGAQNPGAQKPGEQKPEAQKPGAQKPGAAFNPADLLKPIQSGSDNNHQFRPPVNPYVQPDQFRPPVNPYIKPEQNRPQDNQQKPADNQIAKPTDQSPLKAGPDGKIEITEKDFDRIGPKAAEVLKEAGVTKITITPGQGFDTYEAEFKKPLAIDQDEQIDGCRKLKIDTKLKADVVKNPDGSYMLDNIEGLKAEKKILFKYQDADVTKIQMRKTATGESEITSTGSWRGISRDNVRTKPADVYDKAELLFGRMADLKDKATKGGQNPAAPNPYLEIPRLPQR